MYCFEQALDQKCGNDKLEFELLLGKAKLNMLRGQFGKSKEDCLEALKKKKDDEQAWYILARSRVFVEKFQEAMDYINEGLSILPVVRRGGHAGLWLGRAGGGGEPPTCN